MVGIKLWRGFLGFAKESVLNWVKKKSRRFLKEKKKRDMIRGVNLTAVGQIVKKQK